MAAAPPDIRLTETETALAAAPIWEKQVLELRLEWPGGAELPVDQQWAASRLRVFLLTWDPFEWQSDRGVAFATSTSRADDAGLVLYVPEWRVRVLAGDPPDGRLLATAVGRFAESVLAVAAEHRAAITDGSYPAAVQSGTVPRLLSRVPSELVLEAPTVSVVGGGWQPVQFEVLEDLAQDGFGPADLDRSPVSFTEPGEGRASCPACAGQTVAFPDGLKEAQESICGPHRAEALRITTTRLEASQASNPAGWAALLDAGQRLTEPHLPNGLGPRLVAASLTEAPTGAQLADDAALVVSAASLMTGLPDPQTVLGGRLAPVRPWLERLPSLLAAEGMSEEANEAMVAADELLADAAAVAAAAAAEEAAAAVAEAKPKPFRREVRVGRNAPCPCGSGQKYKFCHG
jgi:hypothetical protein